MAYSLTRLTLFAIISSIEQDLRQQAILHLKDHISAEEIFTRDVYEKCLDRYMKENGFTSEKPNLEDLILYSDLADVYQALNMHR